MQSLKKYLIYSCCSMPLIDDLQDSKIIIVTHSGVITGSPIAEDESDSTIYNWATISSTFADNYRKQHSIDESQSLDGNDGFVTLKDVEFKSGTATYHFNVLNIFFDQIVGITVGSTK